MGKLFAQPIGAISDQRRCAANPLLKNRSPIEEASYVVVGKIRHGRTSEQR